MIVRFQNLTADFLPIPAIDMAALPESDSGIQADALMWLLLWFDTVLGILLL